MISWRGTHGRGIWILDDITPLRQIGAEDGKDLCSPQPAARPVWTNTDTPLPPTSRGIRSARGAIIDTSAGRGRPVVLEVSTNGALVRRLPAPNRCPAARSCDERAAALYWYNRPLVATAGTHFTWTHYQPLPAAAEDAGVRRPADCGAVRHRARADDATGSPWGAL
jgi:hypothetical protein